MTPVLQRLFLLAAAGVLLALGLVVASFGRFALTAYAGVVLLLVGLGVRRARAVVRSRQPAARPVGRTCTCCTSTVHDPVQVI